MSTAKNTLMRRLQEGKGDIRHIIIGKILMAEKVKAIKLHG